MGINLYIIVLTFSCPNIFSPYTADVQYSQQKLKADYIPLSSKQFMTSHKTNLFTIFHKAKRGQMSGKRDKKLDQRNLSCKVMNEETKLLRQCGRECPMCIKFGKQAHKCEGKICYCCDVYYSLIVGI